MPDNLKTPGAPAQSPQNSKRDELLLLINSLNPIITVETTEEERLEGLLRSISVQLVVPLYTWSVTTGLAKLSGSPLYGTTEPEQALANIALIEAGAIFLLRDFARYCDNDRISRRLRDLADKFRSARRSIVIAAATIELPPELKGDSVPFQLGLPDANELSLCVNQVLTETSRDRRVLMTLDAPAIAQLAHNLVGLTKDDATRTLRRCLLARGVADAALLDAVLDAKRAALQADGVLEPVRRDTTFLDVAGLKHLREWVDKRRNALTPEGQSFGLVPPKGVLITGVQGCGKSMAARAIAGEWGIELVRLDAGSLYDKYVGESEKRLHKALELAQKLAPVVMWIDEIEKAFASASSSGDADAGLSQRLLATLLTWMQDHKSSVLPDAEARGALFAIRLKKCGRDASAFDLQKLAAATDGFSGAEIEQAVASGLYTAFGQKQQLTTEILLAEVHNTQPLSVTRTEDIQALRAWAKDRAVPAD